MVPEVPLQRVPGLLEARGVRVDALRGRAVPRRGALDDILEQLERRGEVLALEKEGHHVARVHGSSRLIRGTRRGVPALAGRRRRRLGDDRRRRFDGHRRLRRRARHRDRGPRAAECAHSAAGEGTTTRTDEARVGVSVIR